MTERMRFVADYLEGVYRVSELAERYGVSRKTAYKWLKRFEEEGPGGLQERAPVAEEVWNRTERVVEDALVAFRKKHMDWGPRKILDVLGRRQPDVEWPATSTVAAILKRNGLVEGRRRRRREGHPGRPAGEPQAPNEVWGMDFKGQFRTRDGRYCFPFTVTDLASRYLLCCDGYLSIHGEGVRTSLERVFRQHGMPEAIRSDNGAPFASTGIARLTRLGVWLVVARDHEAAHRAGAAGSKRQARAHAPNPQGRHDAAAGGEPAPAARALHLLSAGVQRGAASRRPGDETTRRGLPTLAASIPRDDSTDRVPRPLRGPPRQSQRWGEVEAPVAQRGPRAHRAERRVSRGRGWDLGRVLQHPPDRSLRRTDFTPCRDTRDALPLWKAWRS